MEKWFIRFLMGFPPRAESKDRLNFFRTFPEIKSKDDFIYYFEDYFRYQIPRHIYDKEFINLWILDKKINNDYKKCDIDNCPFKNNELNKNYSQENDYDGTIQNNLMTIHNDANKKFNNKGMDFKIIDKMSKIISENKEFKLYKISIVDPYLFLNISKDESKMDKRNKIRIENAKRFIKKIISNYNNVDINIYSDIIKEGNKIAIEEVKKFIDNINPNITSSKHIKLFNSDNSWHDRPIVLSFKNETEEKHSGILIGASFDGILASKIYYVCDIDNDDIKNTIKNLKCFKELKVQCSFSQSGERV
ncbi:hypothetical protein ACWNT8_14175 [Pigmentibacter ruber]